MIILESSLGICMKCGPIFVCFNLFFMNGKRLMRCPDFSNSPTLYQDLLCFKNKFIYSS